MDIRRGILGGTTLLFAMAAPACPDEVVSGDAPDLLDSSVDAVTDHGGDQSAQDQGVPLDGTPVDTGSDTPSPDIAADTGAPSADADAAGDAGAATDLNASDATGDLVTADHGAGDITGADGAVGDGGAVSDGGAVDTQATDGGADVSVTDSGDSDATPLDASSPDGSVDDLGSDAATDLGANDAGSCVEPDLAGLVNHPCDSKDHMKGYCDDGGDLVVGCYAGTWQDAASIEASSGLVACGCAAPSPDCSPTDFFCAIIGYAGVSLAGYDRRGGVSLRIV